MHTPHTYCPFFLPLLVFCFLLTACNPHTGAKPNPLPAPAPAVQVQPVEKAVIAAVWKPVLQRLIADGVDPTFAQAYFAELANTPSSAPMGRKIKELYTKKFLHPVKPATPPAKKKPTGLYKGVVTHANALRCADFIQANRAAFESAEQCYGVPKEVAAALLFVETRHGSFLGKENAFTTLASMASSTEPALIQDWLTPLPGVDQHSDWLQETMRKRSDWAYKELLALMLYSQDNKLDPYTMPGSIYGAIGLCQFMPSNIPLFGADGDADGKIDLFCAADAIASLARYLKENGWKTNSSTREQHKVLMRYNRSTIYANTILALAQATRELE